MNTPNRRKRDTVNNRTGSIITTLLLFACVITIAFFTYQMSINPSANPKDIINDFQWRSVGEGKEAKRLYSFTFESRENPVFEIYDGYIAKCTSDGIWFYDKSGHVAWSKSMAYNNPMLKTNGDELIIADIGANDICVIKGKSTLWDDRLDASILNADINKDGYVTVVTTSKRDNNEVRVYDPRGVELFRKVIANDYVVSAHISPSGEFLAVSGISINSMGAYSKYKLYDLEGNELADKSFEEEGEMLPIFWYNKENNIYIGGDKAIAYLDKTGKIIWEKEFKNVAGADIIAGRQIAVTVEADDGIWLKLYMEDGSEVFSHKLQSKPEGLREAGNRIAVYTENKIYLYSGKGEEIGKYHSTASIQQVMFFDKKTAAVIAGNTVTIINIV